jgi:hypothetical protein
VAVQGTAVAKQSILVRSAGHAAERTPHRYRSPMDDRYPCPECGNTDTEWVPKGWPTTQE